MNRQKKPYKRTIYQVVQKRKLTLFSRSKTCTCVNVLFKRKARVLYQLKLRFLVLMSVLEKLIRQF